MLSDLFCFEMRYHVRQLIFKVTALLFLALGVLCAQGNFGGNTVHTNSPYVVTYITGLLSLFTIFVSTICCASVVLRDTTYRMDQLLFTTAVKKLPYFLVRFSALLIVVFMTLILATAGIAISAWGINSGQTGIFRLSFFLQPLLVMGLPNVLFVCTVIFCTALLTRSIRAIYTAGVLLYILYSIAAILGNSPLFASSALKTGTPDPLSLLVDPFGLAIFLGDTRLWSDVQRNQQLYELKGLFLQNRLLWTALSTMLLFITYKAFSFRLHVTIAGKRASAKATPVAAISYTPVSSTVAGYRYHWNSFLSQCRLEVVQLFRHIPFLVMLALWIFIFAIELKDTLYSGAYGVQFYATTGFMADALRSVKPAMLLIIFYTAELADRERSNNIASLLYSTPLPDTMMWAAKYSTLVILVITLITANIGIGISLQVSNGYYHIDMLPYLSLYYYSGIPLLLFAVLTLFIQTLAGNKYLGMVLNMFLALLIISSRRLGIEHYLLRYATAPDMTWSDMNGFGHYATAFNWYMLYWSLAATILSILTVQLWQRSSYIKQRFRLLRFQWAVAIPALLYIAVGSFIYYKTNIEGTYRSAKAQLGWRLRYEQQYRAMADMPQPVITAVRTHVDLYPGDGRYTVNGTYQLSNQTTVPIPELWISIDPEVNSCHISLPVAANMTYDPVFKQYLYELKKPLYPGDSLQLSFTMEIIRSGFTDLNKEHTVVSNGSYVELEKFVPSLGYNDRWEVTDSVTRKTDGMLPHVALFSTDSNYHLIDYETTISVAPDQQVVTVGQLQQTWLKDGRRYFHYKTPAPINFMFAFAAGHYALSKEIYKGITYRIFYHPGHTQNLAAMMQGMKDAIDYGSEQFGTYPLKTLTLAEIPHYKGAATAYPGVIFSAERLNFQTNFSDSNKVNYAYGTTVHETAHQWWANLLSPADQPGKAFLTETLAQYTESMVLEKQQGRTLLRKYLQNDNHLYFVMQDKNERELPLVGTVGQSAVCYQKGTLAMYGLKELLGEARLNNALHRLLAKHAYPHTKARATDLVKELYATADDREIRHINDWLQRTFIYFQQISIRSCERQKNGQYKLTLEINIIKQDLATGKESAPDDDIDIAVFGHPVEKWQTSPPLYLQKHHFSDSKTLLTIQTDTAPVTVAIDPYCYIPDPDQENNIATL
ncbi:ABC transporter permease/M1 family aminopeptidase [Chitinophaga agri]|uniref:Peptidase M1 membrane alanine aminopeptidase domain-containing protein n=1 Tax=Chitinophaga agri TaxID=2703787 RepID=A0A6B9ZQ59_9BACT|nr:M1 family aminopeptidase [Chitinophaga agri]QHS63704.1 hypothetical protein GWR21_30225 [Chitinophaga agri]